MLNRRLIEIVVRSEYPDAKIRWPEFAIPEDGDCAFFMMEITSKEFTDRRLSEHKLWNLFKIFDEERDRIGFFFTRIPKERRRIDFGWYDISPWDTNARKAYKAKHPELTGLRYEI